MQTGFRLAFVLGFKRLQSLIICGTHTAHLSGHKHVHSLPELQRGHQRLVHHRLAGTCRNHSDHSAKARFLPTMQNVGSLDSLLILQILWKISVVSSSMFMDFSTCSSSASASASILQSWKASHPPPSSEQLSECYLGGIGCRLLQTRFKNIKHRQKYLMAAMACQVSHVPVLFPSCSRLVPVLFPGMWTFGAENLDASSISSLRLGPTRGQAFATRSQL